MRQLLVRRYWQRIEERRLSLRRGVSAQWWTDSTRVPFIDYWSEIPGTIPEKIVFAELVRRQINFYFSWYFGNMTITPYIYERYRPDFYLPDYKIIIEVFGAYWHTRPGMYEHDLVKAITYTAAGYTFYVLSDIAVLNNVIEAINDAIPELRAPAYHGNMHIVGDRPFNPTASIAARLHKWPLRSKVRYSSRRRAWQADTSWQTSKAPKRPIPDVDPMFTELTQEQLEAADWLQEMYDWIRRRRKTKKKKRQQATHPAPAPAPRRPRRTPPSPPPAPRRLPRPRRKR